MADLVSIADGNLTTAATWGVVDATSKNVSTNTGQTALTTGNLDSATFTPGAITVSGLCVRVTNRAAGTPTNTMTVTLRNSTGAVNVKSVTVNVSLLPRTTTGTNSEGGWLYLKFDANVTLLAATLYLVRATLSATSTAVALATNGVANNWQRLLVTTTTQVPAAGDDMHICGLLDGAATPVTAIGARAVTMDSVAATDYGSAVANSYQGALDISTGGTLAYGTTAATNYVLRLSGFLKVYNAGTFTMGTTGTPCPRDSTMVLEFDCAADNDFGPWFMNGSTVSLQGQSRTAGKDISLTLLTADAAAAATSITVADDTGWKNGDQIAVAGTARTCTEAEDVTLGADAGASTITVGALTNAHLGQASYKYQAEVLLLTRAVILRSVSSTAMMNGPWFLAGTPSASVVSTFDIDWVQFRYTSGLGNAVGVGSSLTFDHCVAWGVESSSSQGAWYNSTAGAVGASDTFALRNCGVYHFLTPTGIGLWVTSSYAFAGTGDRFIVDNFTVIGKQTGANTTGTIYFGIYLDTTSPVMAIGTLRVSCATYGLFINQSSTGKMMGRKWGPFYFHTLDATSSGIGLYISAAVSGLRFGDLYAWRGDAGIYVDVGSLRDIRFEGRTQLTGNIGGGMKVDNTATDVDFAFADLMIAGDTTFASGYGLEFAAENLTLLIEKADIGVASGIFVVNTGTGIAFDRLQGFQIAAILRNVVTASATEYTPAAGLGLDDWTADSFVAWERKDGTTTNHLTWTPLGIIAYETGTVQDSPGLKLTPSINQTALCNLRLQSNANRPGRGYMVPVLSGNTVQVAVGVRKDGTYAGNAPRLIVKANSALGIDADAVLDTLTVGANTWETLTGTTASVTDNGVLEFVVDCDGLAGNVYVNQWASGVATPAGDETTWFDGLPFRAGAAGTSTNPAGGGGSGGGTRGYAFP